MRARADGSAIAALYADIARVEVVALKPYEVINDVDVPPLPVPALPAKPTVDHQRNQIFSVTYIP